MVVLQQATPSTFALQPTPPTLEQLPVLQRKVFPEVPIQLISLLSTDSPQLTSIILSSMILDGHLSIFI